jgi:hypothetical protein
VQRLDAGLGCGECSQELLSDFELALFAPAPRIRSGRHPRADGGADEGAEHTSGGRDHDSGDRAHRVSLRRLLSVVVAARRDSGGRLARGRLLIIFDR